MSKANLNPSTCYNLSFFKGNALSDVMSGRKPLSNLLNDCVEMMKEYRKVDDNIMLRMNTTDTHSEAGCAEFFKQLAEAYQKREDTVNYCLKVMDDELDRKNKKLEDDPYDNNLKDAMYTEESKRRMVSNELMVEDIVRQRSLQVFRSKCRIFDVPQDIEDFLNKRR